MFRTPLNNPDALACVFRHCVLRFVALLFFSDFTGLGWVGWFFFEA